MSNVIRSGAGDLPGETLAPARPPAGVGSRGQSNKGGVGRAVDARKGPRGADSGRKEGPEEWDRVVTRVRWGQEAQEQVVRSERKTRRTAAGSQPPGTQGRAHLQSQTHQTQCKEE